MVVNTNNFLIMAFGESSFRRILLSRLLCLSVPFLIFGIYVTYRKARSAFLDTARQNLTESSVRKGESINQAIEAIRGNLATASSIANLKTKSKANHQLFVQQLHHALPMGVECVQIQDVRTQEITGGTCRSQLTNLSENDFPLTQSFKENLTPLEEVKVKFISPVESNQNSVRLYPKNSLNLLFYAPIYNAQGYLQYKLLVQLTLIKNEKVEPGSLDGYSVVINEDGVILAHPIAQRIGKNIRDMPDATRLESILRNAVEGKENFLHLFSFEKNDVELVAGYTAIPSPITGEEGKKWVILAVSRLDLALLPLKTIQHLLTSLAFVLIIVNILAILYISRELALPIEKLSKYALNLKNLDSQPPLPSKFNIKEFNYLSFSLDQMVRRLQTSAKEIMSAWQEAKNANKLKSEFLATTSHELRTPLNGIINSIRIVKDGYCDSHAEEIDFLQQADDAAIHLLGIINDVLDISKIEAGKLSVRIEKLNLIELIREVLDLQKAPIQQKKLQLITDFIEAEVLVLADPAKLKQVILNVLTNAIKFTEYGSITVKVRNKNQIALNSNFQKNGRKSYQFNLEQATVEPTSISHNQTFRQVAVLEIIDTGIGIDRSQQSKLFRPFVMVDGSTTRKFGGTGLGLAISRNLMQLMDGDISLKSEGLGRGTTVQIILPGIESPLNVEKIPLSNQSEK